MTENTSIVPPDSHSSPSAEALPSAGDPSAHGRQISAQNFPKKLPVTSLPLRAYYRVVFAARLPGETPLLVIGGDGFAIDLIMVLAAGQR
jgi:hypothetical protein